jgi:hypothetical protein
MEGTPLSNVAPVVTVTGKTVGPYQAEGGVNATGSQLTGSHASASTVWSAPSGNGSQKSLSANNWGAGDFYQFSFSTLNYGDLTVSFDQTGSGTGPSSFKIATSTDGSSFTDLPSGGYSVALSTWTPTTVMSGFTHTFSLPSGLYNAATVYVRLIQVGTTSINGGTVGSTGTDRVDNFIVVPEAPGAVFGTLVCCAFGLTYSGRLFRRQKSEASA